MTLNDPDRALPAMNWRWTLAMGGILLIGGVASILFPFVASLIVTGYAAVAFLVGGALQLWLAVRREDGTSGGQILAGLMGLLMIVFALSLFFDPFAGLVSLTILAAVFFLALGGLRILVAMRMRPRRRWGWVAASGALSVVLGLVILLALPGSAASTLGLLLGVELSMAGTAAIALSLSARAE